MYKTQEICETGVDIRVNIRGGHFVPDRLKTQEMCNKAIKEKPWSLADVPNHLSGRTKYVKKAVPKYPYSLKFVPDLFMAPEMC